LPYTSPTALDETLLPQFDLDDPRRRAASYVNIYNSQLIRDLDNWILFCEVADVVAGNSLLLNAQLIKIKKHALRVSNRPKTIAHDRIDLDVFVSLQFFNCFLREKTGGTGSHNSHN